MLRQVLRAVPLQNLQARGWASWFRLVGFVFVEGTALSGVTPYPHAAISMFLF